MNHSSKNIKNIFQLGVLKRLNISEWEDLTVIQPKNNVTVRFLSNLTKINQRICRKIFPIPKKQVLLLKIKGFVNTSSLDLSMGY